MEAIQCAHDIDFQKIPQKIQNIFTPIHGLKTNHYKRNIETQPSILYHRQQSSKSHLPPITSDIRLPP